MKRVFIIHGWGGFPEEAWFPWLKKEMETRGFEVQVPKMPHTDEPKIEVWVPFLRELINLPDEDTYLVGHSIGCQAILRYLSDLQENMKLGGIVLVAGWVHKLLGVYDKDEIEIARPWVETSINFESIKNHTKNITAIFSDNDEFVPPDNVAVFEEKLGAKTIMEHNKGHFDQSTGIKELPVVLKELLKMARE